MKKFGFFLLAVSLGLACATNSQKDYSPQNISLQHQILTAPSGEDFFFEGDRFRLRIPRDAFPGHEQVGLEYKEVKSFSDAILTGLNTNSSQGLLSSNGMVYLNFKDPQSGKQLFNQVPITIAFAGQRPDDKLYFGSDNDGSFSWGNPIDSLKFENRTSINGKRRAQFSCDDSYYEAPYIRYSFWSDFYFSLPKSSYGWINCDSLIEATNPIKITTKILPNSRVVLILPDRNVIYEPWSNEQTITLEKGELAFYFSVTVSEENPLRASAKFSDIKRLTLDQDMTLTANTEDSLRKDAFLEKLTRLLLSDEFSRFD